MGDQCGRSLKHDFSQRQLAYWHIAAHELQPSILAVILSWPNETQLPINTGLAYNAMFRVLDERQKAPSARTPSRNTKHPQRQRQLSPLCSARHEEESASIELLNRVSIADGKRWDTSCLVYHFQTTLIHGKSIRTVTEYIFWLEQSSGHTRLRLAPRCRAVPWMVARSLKMCILFRHFPFLYDFLSLYNSSLQHW